METFVGQIILAGFNFAPRGYALCAGQIMSISQWTAVFSLLGTTYGGNGQSTFGLPNLQGRLAIGQGQGAGLSNYVIGEMGGVENTSLLISNMPAHNHIAVVTPSTLNGSGVATGDIAIPAQDGGAGTNIPSPSAYLGKPSAPIYAAASDTTLKPFSATLTAAVSVAPPTVQVGITGGSIPFSVQQPFLTLNYSIALQGIFPSRN